MADSETLPDDWMDQDARNSYYEAVRVIGEAVKSGERELPAFFRPMRERKR